jgi:hypothetical protein
VKVQVIWSDWIEFLQNEENVEKFHPYRYERTINEKTIE